MSGKKDTTKIGNRTIEIGEGTIEDWLRPMSNRDFVNLLVDAYVAEYYKQPNLPNRAVLSCFKAEVERRFPKK
jgi:hypothetical protein